MKKRLFNIGGNKSSSKYELANNTSQAQITDNSILNNSNISLNDNYN